MASRVEKKSRTRQALLDAAAKLVARDGAQATSLDRIAEEAGLTKGAVYSNFSGKEDLLFTLAETAAGPTLSLNDFATDGESLADVFEQLGRAMARELRTAPPRTWRLGLEIFYFGLRNARARKKLAAIQREDAEATGVELEELAASRGEELPLPGREFAILIQAVALGLAQYWAINPKAVPDHVFARAFRLLAGESGS